jgi:TRAP-type uncharacterized transport system substrate-binding protein
VGAQCKTSERVDEDIVCEVTNALWNDPTGTLMDLGQATGREATQNPALDGIAIPLHAGAEQYVRETCLLT